MSGQGVWCAYPGTCRSPSRSWWSRSPQPDAGSWSSLIHLERTCPPSSVVPQWCPLISGCQPVTSARWSHQGPALTLRPWRQQDACSLKEIQVVNMNSSHINICYFSVQMTPVFTGSAATWTQQAEVKTLIDWQWGFLLPADCTAAFTLSASAIWGNDEH